MYDTRMDVQLMIHHMMMMEILSMKIQFQMCDMQMGKLLMPHHGKAMMGRLLMMNSLMVSKL